MIASYAADTLIELVRYLLVLDEPAFGDSVIPSGIRVGESLFETLLEREALNGSALLMPYLFLSEIPLWVVPPTELSKTSFALIYNGKE